MTTIRSKRLLGNRIRKKKKDIREASTGYSKREFKETILYNLSLLIPNNKT